MTNRSAPLLTLLAILIFQTASADIRTEQEPPGVPPCLGCHSSLRGENYLHREKYLESVHGHLACLECHDSTRIAATDPVHRESVPLSAPARDGIPDALRKKSPFSDALAACGRCHEAVFAAVRQSIHGKAIFEQGITDAAFCTDCHEPIHYLRRISETTSSVARANLINTCSRCHANRIIASRYNLNVYVVQSYKAHFHGKKHTLGGRLSPTCVNCHGHHSIRDVQDPRSRVSPQNKVSLCAECHKGATAEFAAAFTHTPLNAGSNPVAFRIRTALVILLIFFVVLLGLHLLLDITSELRSLRTRKRRPPARQEIPWSLFQSLPRQVERMDIHLRIQHGILFVSVFYLGASGLALKFPDQGFSQAWIRLWGGVETAGHLHRFAALILIINALYHLAYVVIQIFRRKFSFSIVPSAEDLRHLFQNIQYLTGRRSAPPHFDRFTYTQKLDYWLIVFMVLMMITTGLMYWFPTVTARILPSEASRWIWGIAYVIHSYEALLILFFAFAWHFYNVHLKSRVFPMSWVWITGKIDLEDLIAEHPKEFEAILEKKKKEFQQADEARKDPFGSP